MHARDTICVKKLQFWTFWPHRI